MTATTKGYNCAAGAWTEIAAGKINVLVSLRTIGAGYLKTASSLPADAPNPDAAPGAAAYDFLTVSNEKPASFAFSDTTTKVYFWPVGKALIVEVVAE
jgi:hypothetical protein